jgi:GTP-binding protein HflX
MENAASGRENAILVGCELKRSSSPAAARGAGLSLEESLDELAALASAARAKVAARLQQQRSRYDPAYLIGKGKVERLKGLLERHRADTVIFDDNLSPAQQRNIEQALDCKVVDRTQLILDIFASRARTREGKLQVELAQLQYLLPRLAGMGAAMSRLGAGIGTRGPGETKLESDRRRIRQRIARLGRELDTVRRRRSQSRDRRRKDAVPTVALVGYTNAGKTSLFNRLTRSDAAASSALFATLDPLVRPVRLPDRRTVLLADTVGFIDRLPHTLVAAFRATLEAVAEAELLLHVVDAAHPARADRIAAVQRVLGEVEAASLPQVLVFNKCDQVDEADRARLRRAEGDTVCVSARTGLGTEDLVSLVTRAVEMQNSRVTLDFDQTAPGDRQRLAALYRHGRVLRQTAGNGHVSVEAEVPRRLIALWRAQAAARRKASGEEAGLP